VVVKNNQSKSRVGGKRPGAGRPKGSVNKATADVKAAAQEYSDRALKVLAQIMEEGDSAAARVAAANSILDRAHGKPRQSVELDADVNANVQAVTRVELVGPGE
jgi:predicted ArsR family transcriptional regulator